MIDSNAFFLFATVHSTGGISKRKDIFGAMTSYVGLYQATLV